MSTERTPFVNRVRIVGKLTLDSDLHVGDGGVVPDAVAASDDDQQRRPSDIATVARDAHGNPVIPGAAIKGVLRSYLDKTKALQPLVDAVFGRAPGRKTLKAQELSEEEQGTGGKVEFAYARLLPSPKTENAETTPDTSCDLPVQSSVGINRVTGAAHDRALHSHQYVPRGRAFEVELIGYDLDIAEIGLLLHALHGFDIDRERLRLGAGHANQAGLATWELVALHYIQPADVKHWFSSPLAELPDWRSLGKLNDRARKKFEDEAGQAIRTKLGKSVRLTCEIELQFDGPFLANDARAVSDKADHRPRMTPDDKVLLPARGFRGAFRSQAERIVRTLSGDAGGDPFVKPARSRATAKIAAASNTIIDELFGNTGRRAALEISDFVSDAKSSDAAVQEFVAIDRFTGGAADAKKFNTHYVDRPLLKGRLSILLKDLRRESLGLLALTIRDLIEGDITFGWGAAKGYGACRAKVTRIACPGSFETVSELMTEPTFDAKQWKSSHNLLHKASPLDPNLLDPAKSVFPALLADAVQQLHAKLGVSGP